MREEVKSFLEGLKKTYKLSDAINKVENVSLNSVPVNGNKTKEIEEKEKQNINEKEPIEKVNYVLFLFANELLKKI